MKRLRMKALGLGLTLAAGGGVAVADDTGAPGMLPAGLREPALVKVEPGPVWLPARSPVAPAPVAPAPVTPAPAPITPAPVAVAPAGGVVEPPVGAALAPTNPRAGGSIPAQLPALPPIPEAPAYQPEAPPPRPVGPQPKQPSPLPTPKPVDPRMPPPRVPGGAELPPPRVLPELHAQPQPELPLAPPNLMYAGAMTGVGKHGTFGSPPIRLSRDYPPLRDLVQKGHSHDDVTLAPDGIGSGPADRFFLSGEYLLWWMPGFATPILGTTNPDGNLNGYLGEPGTTAIIGPGSLIDSTRHGFRIRAGAMLSDCGTCGIDGSFFFLGNRSTSIVAGSDQFPLITRPVFVPNPIPGTDTPFGENGEAVAVPGILRGTLSVDADSRLWGADVNLRKRLCGTCDTRAEVFAGYRHLNLRESLTITENISVIAPGGDRLGFTDPVGTQVLVQDRFATGNYFHGGQFGGLYERRFGRWDIGARGSLALGTTYQTLEISGFQVRQPPDMPAMRFTGGLLAAGPNIGRFTKNRFSVVPELTLNVGYRVTDSLRVFAGYNFLVWTNVIRPGDQIDRVVDLTFVPNAPPGVPFSGQARPQPLFKQTDLVINGIQFGMELRW